MTSQAQSSYIDRLLRRNSNTVYENTAEDRAIIRKMLSSKIEEALQKPVDIVGTKNLIYYSVFNSRDYLDILEISLKTIAEKSDTTLFDVLFITDEEFKNIILTFPIISKFNAKFFIKDTTKDGVDAAVQKMAIFQWPEIDNYSKIICLDCDIVALKDINEIFPALKNPDKLEVALNPALFSFIVSTDKRGEGFFTLEELDEIEEKQIKAFNSGQYAFLNTPRIRAHFDNAYWLQGIWPGYFFFEQSLMNNYFMFHGFCSKEVLDTRIKFQSIFNLDDRKTKIVQIVDGGKTKLHVKIENDTPAYISKIKEINTDEFVLVHFIGACLNGHMKMKCIDLFLKEKNICQ